jgi:queuine/archaeosine tRNA-ribosyltransferase
MPAAIYYCICIACPEFQRAYLCKRRKRPELTMVMVRRIHAAITSLQRYDRDENLT